MAPEAPRRSSRLNQRQSALPTWRVRVMASSARRGLDRCRRGRPLRGEAHCDRFGRGEDPQQVAAGELLQVAVAPAPANQLGEQGRSLCPSISAVFSRRARARARAACWATSGQPAAARARATAMALRPRSMRDLRRHHVATGTAARASVPPVTRPVARRPPRGSSGRPRGRPAGGCRSPSADARR
jgi:hypothetical protein